MTGHRWTLPAALALAVAGCDTPPEDLEGRWIGYCTMTGSTGYDQLTVLNSPLEITLTSADATTLAGQYRYVGNDEPINLDLSGTVDGDEVEMVAVQTSSGTVSNYYHGWSYDYTATTTFTLEGELRGGQLSGGCERHYVNDTTDPYYAEESHFAGEFILIRDDGTEGGGV